MLSAPDTAYVVPGVVDTHVHVNEPGRTEWEGFVSATEAAALGGATTLIDMPLNSIPPTTTIAGLRAKQAAAEGELMVDVGFWGGAVPGNLADLEPLWEAGVFGFKCFLAPSGVDEFPPLDPPQFREHLAEIARLGGLMIVHAEDARVLDAAPVAAEPGLRRLPALAARRRRDRRDPAGDRRRAARPARGCTSCTCRAPAPST